MGSGSTSVPPPPPMSFEERNLLNQQTQSLQQVSGLLKQSSAQNKEQQDLFKSLSGLYDSYGNVDPDKVNALRTQNEAYQKQADEVSSLQSQRYLKALKGELPVSEGTLQRKDKEFSLLKEAAARRGNVIEGDAPDSAMGLSSAAAANLGQFNRTYKLIEDSERRGELASGGMGGAPGGVPLGFAGSAMAYSPASLLPGYSSLSAGYGQAVQPYADQRLLGYQGSLQQASLNSRSNPLGAGVAGAGTGAMIGSKFGPQGALIGAGIGGLAGYLGGR